MIYVDGARQVAPTSRWPYKTACHLFTRPGHLTELHSFARGLRMERSWFQDHKVMPHYDLTSRMRRQAVRLGAIQLTNVEMVQVMQEWRKEKGFGNGENQEQKEAGKEAGTEEAEDSSQACFWPEDG